MKLTRLKKELRWQGERVHICEFKLLKKIILKLDRVNCADSAYFITETCKPLIKWSPSGLQVVTKCSPSAPQVLPKWSPIGHQVVTKWSPIGHQVVTKWSPGSHQVVT